MRQATGPSQSRQHGLGMIEILITLLVLVTGVIGAASLHLSSLRENQHINQRLQAITLAEDIRGRLMLNRGVSDNYVFDTSTNPTAYPLNTWKERVDQLPNGRIIVTRRSTDPEVFSIRIFWNETGGSQVTGTSCDPTQNDPTQLTCFQLVVQL
ncbi:hypothetical protein ACKC9G_15190 [Pokkaliibacter sp. CJK22405]|uniref:type IV pilus modification PilV family protein n=1 Tax=Pokkaliibacter sp. CJK22405 TaxID=3384615 RepID=UPI0039848314